jgi:hypothetical protein
MDALVAVIIILRFPNSVTRKAPHFFHMLSFFHPPKLQKNPDQSFRINYLAGSINPFGTAFAVLPATRVIAFLFQIKGMLMAWHRRAGNEYKKD